MRVVVTALLYLGLLAVLAAISFVTGGRVDFGAMVAGSALFLALYSRVEVAA